LTFLNILGDYFISHEKWTCAPKSGGMVAIPSNATHMRPVQI